MQRMMWVQLIVSLTAYLAGSGYLGSDTWPQGVHTGIRGTTSICSATKRAEADLRFRTRLPGDARDALQGGSSCDEFDSNTGSASGSRAVASSMDYSKIDAALAAALAHSQDREAPTIDVFIHAVRSLNRDEIAFLETLGVSSEPGKTIFTARLSARAIEELSRQSWVRYIKLSQKLRPLED
jgi:hypothetical protein